MKKYVCLLIIFYSIASMAQSETIKVPWPDGWKLASQIDNTYQRFEEYIPGNEKLENWTQRGLAIALKGQNTAPLEMLMNVSFNTYKKDAVNARLTVLDKKTDGKNPWILFKIEADGFTKKDKVESTMGYFLKGNYGIYNNYVAIKQLTMSKEFTDRWTKIFTSSQLVQK